MEFTRCYGCMRELDAPGARCPKCGFDNTNDPARQPSHVLKCGTILDGQYVVGRSLGQGGFGITYLGYDLKLEMPVCIKEYYPEGAAMRSSTQSSMVYWGSSENAQSLKDSRASFVKEAQKAVKLRNLSHVVSVWSVFYENETAYIVMDYIEGETLKDKLVRTQKPLDEKACVELLTPVMRDLEKAHALGIIHRDIKPENLMLDAEGEPVLLDMGAAKDLTKSTRNGSTLSSALVVSQGFSPLEQYSQNGSIGPWTDVYAMCATICYCVTGRLIPAATERVTGEGLDLSSLSAPFAAVLEKGLAIKAGDRYQGMGELLDALTAAVNPKAPKPKRLIPALAVAAALLVAVGVYFWKRPDSNAVLTELPATPTASVTDAPAETPEAATVMAETNAESTTEPTPEQASEQNAADLIDAAIGDTVKFGAYEQDNNTANGKEEIEWLVLDKQNGRLLLISKYGLDCQPYNTEYVSLTWADCYLRVWLNNSFLGAAFDKAEQEAIPAVTVENGKSQGYNGFSTDGGEDTQDSVFLLSYAEAWKYFADDSARVCRPTEYAKARNPYVKSSSFGSDEGWWWLRSPGNTMSSAANVYTNGSLSAGDITNGDGLVRPALWIEPRSGSIQQQAVAGVPPTPTETDTPIADPHISAEELFSQARAAERGDHVARDYGKAAELYRLAANAGSVEALTGLGMLYATGRGVERDYVSAEKYFQQAAEAGDPDAMCALGELYYCGYIGKLDYTKALEWYLKAADKQSFAAMAELGFMYYSGNGVKRNTNTAEKWFDRAANCLDNGIDTSDVITAYCLGRLYYFGYGVERDDSQALEYIQKAANEGYAGAISFVGVLYRGGRGVNVDYAKALECFQRAAEAGAVSGWSSLANLYCYGYGVSQDYAKAMEYYQKSADAGTSSAMYEIGYMYFKGNGVPQNYGKAMEWYRKAADLGYSSAVYGVGFLYYMGYGVSKDYGEAMEWCLKAAELESGSAMYTIGLMYHYGQGVSVDYEKAMEWYQKSANAGSSTGMYSIGYLYEEGLGVPQSDSKAREWYQKAADAGDPNAKTKLNQ